MERKALFSRKTKETEVILSLCIDGKGEYEIYTTIPFLDHMLELFSKHSLFNLSIKARGDTKIDPHHLTEDIAISLGKAFKEALGNKIGIKRYGSITLPMDETLVSVNVDISGRPYLVFNAPSLEGKIGNFDCELLEDFFRAFTINAEITLHIDLLRGRNLHHICEAIFKAVAVALKEATEIDRRVNGIPSTKGVL